MPGNNQTDNIEDR